MVVWQSISGMEEIHSVMNYCKCYLYTLPYTIGDLDGLRDEPKNRNRRESCRFLDRAPSMGALLRVKVPP
jgi:hypothetical protein